jgi:hypothetical protein
MMINIKKCISYKYDKNHTYNIKMRYEFDINKDGKNKSCYLYFDTWEDFLLFYNNIDENKRHFYEMFDDKIKFFLDIDYKENCSDEEWNLLINIIKNKLIIFLNNITNISNTNIIRCESKYVEKESKRSCHLIVENYSFETKYCKELYRKFINTIDEKIRKYIDEQVYGENRCLRIIGSSKIGSKRIKYDFDNFNNISLKHFVSNIDNTTFIETSKYYKIPDEKNVINCAPRKNNIGKYLYQNILYKDVSEVVKIVHNDFDELKLFFKIRTIKDNIIICNLLRPYYCRCCNRVHELENPFIIAKENKILFYCRRNNLPIEIKLNS